MRKRTPKSGRARPKAAANSPIHFRMPGPLRARVRRFARERNLAEAEALRAALSEHFDEMDSARGLAAAERWQFLQAFASWDRFRRKRGRTVAREEIDRIFADALARRGRRRAG